MQKIGVLLLNLGTPSNCDTASVRCYLKEFLSDPRVVDIPSPARWLLLHAAILPFRSKTSAAAYQQIWSSEGSPLLQHSLALQAALSARLGESYQVALGMRYGSPSIAKALETLQDCTQLIILPLFPQYASASTGSALEKTFSLLSSHWNIPDITVQRDFYAEPGFIKAYADLIQRSIATEKIEMLVLSYHGLPERHIRKSGCANVCTGACPAVDPADKNVSCYRAQCYATSRAIAAALDLPEEKYAVCFQSRLGRTPWIQPYTDALLPDLIQKNIRHIAIACPSFVADCLETLEEIHLRGRAQWESLGGKTFIAVPCLNAEPLWVEALAEKIREHGPPYAL